MWPHQDSQISREYKRKKESAEDDAVGFINEEDYRRVKKMKTYVFVFFVCNLLVVLFSFCQYILLL